MKTTRYSPCILFASIVLLHFASSAQDTVTAQQVIQRFIEVSGGAKSISELKATGAKATGIILGDSVIFTAIKAVPFKYYMKYETAHHGTIETIYNNGKVIIRKDGQPIPISDSSGLEDLQINSLLLADMGYEKLGYTMELVPSEEDSMYKVKLVSPSGRTTLKYYSKRTGYLAKIIYREGLTAYFTNYTNTQGFTISRKETTVNESGQPEEVYITEFTLNPKFDPKIFEF